MTRLTHASFEWFLSERVTSVRHSHSAASGAKLKRDLFSGFEHPPEGKVTFPSQPSSRAHSLSPSCT